MNIFYRKAVKTILYYGLATFVVLYGCKYLILLLDLNVDSIIKCSPDVHIKNYFMSRNKSKISILFWTPTFFFNRASLIEYNKVYSDGICPYSQCEITFDRSKFCNSSAVVFHLHDIHMNDLPPPKQRLKHQRYVLWSVEPPYHLPKRVVEMNSYFNWTMTYRQDSDILSRMMFWKKRHSFVSTNQIDYLNGRKPSVLWIVSNCLSDSRREEYIRRLSKVIPTTILGRCHGIIPALTTSSCGDLSTSDCIKAYARNHTYYFSFENSFCLDYITEKYEYQIGMQLMIPIVFDTNEHKNYKRLAIPNSYIDAARFKSPESLGQYLSHLIISRNGSRNKNYNSFFKWVNRYDISFYNEFEYRCMLCQKLHLDDGSTKIYSDVKKWLFEDAKCRRWSDADNQTVAIKLSETIVFSVCITEETLNIASI